jgi:hypothetical protein
MTSKKNITKTKHCVYIKIYVNWLIVLPYKDNQFKNKFKNKLFKNKLFKNKLFKNKNY